MTEYVANLKEKLDSVSICKSHGFEHMLSVMNHAYRAVEEIDVSPEIKEAIILAALLHDIDDHKFFKTINFDNAREILDGHPNTDLIIEMISLVSSSTNKDSLIEPEWKLIPRYCDRLEAIGDIGLERVIQYNTTNKRPVHTDTTIRVSSIEELNIVANEERYDAYSGNSKSMIDHFYDKLLHVKFPINNDYITNKALKRKNVMAEFVLNYWKEN